MGIINLTPDSFSDGGEFCSTEKVLEQVNNFVSNGVDVIDLGAQSTRPGALEIGAKKESKILIPYLKKIRSQFPSILISIDTFNSEVAHDALLNGADWINDVTGGRRDEEILDVVSEFNCPFVITHSRGNSQNMNNLTNYDDLIRNIIDSLENLSNIATSKNVPKDKIIWDPGMGFSKDTNQNLEILRNIDAFKNYGFPLLIGASRKRFIGDILEEDNPKERDIGTLAISCFCSQKNLHLVRVHNVKINYQVLKVSDQIFR
nr:dihydropteroate synthase [Prochlorococcus marinus]